MPTTRSTIRQALHRLRVAYIEQGGERLAATYRAMRRQRWTLRGITALIERIVPVQRFLELAGQFDNQIGQSGFHHGCHAVFEAIGFRWQVRVASEAVETLEDSPVLLFGNHPSLLTPFLIGASVKRSDVRVLTTEYVRRLIPSFVSHSFPVEVPISRIGSEWRKGGWKRAFTSQLNGLLGTRRTDEERRAVNRQSLRDLAEHIAEGGCAVMFPDGGADGRCPWFPGIAIVLQHIVQMPSDRAVHLIPVREDHSSNRRIYAQLSQGLWASAKRRVMYRKRVCLSIGRPISLRDVVSPESSVEEILARLQLRHAMAFAGQADHA